MSKRIEFGADARAKVKAGVDKLANAVRVTLGPGGQNVILQGVFAPHITKDGVTVARAIDLEDPVENIGASLVKEVAGKTSDQAGDGTTTATVLAQAIFEAGIRNIAAGAKPMELKRGIDLAVPRVIDALRTMSRPVQGIEQTTQIATISANGDAAIGKLVADTIDKVGLEGVITVEHGKDLTTKVTLVQGLQFDRGLIAPAFITDEGRQQTVFEKPLILLVHSTITLIRDLLGIMQHCATSKAPLVIIADDVIGEALGTLVVNKMRGALPVACVKIPGYMDRAEQLQDIATVTGATIVSEANGLKLENVTPAHLGSCDRMIITRTTTTVIGGRGELALIEERKINLRTQIEETTLDHERDMLKRRLAKMAGGVALIQAGGTTETEMREKKDRLDDALSATRAALEEGILPGGGTAYVRAADAVFNKEDNGLSEDVLTGISIVKNILSIPLRLIAENAGYEPSVVYNKVVEKTIGAPRGVDFGFNALTGKYEDLVDAGVIDPTKVTRLALENAASIAGLLLTTKAVVYEAPREGQPLILEGPGIPGMMPMNAPR